MLYNTDSSDDNSCVSVCFCVLSVACKVVYDEMMVPKHQSIEFFYTDTQKITAKCHGDEMSINMPQLPLTAIDVTDERVAVICGGLCIDPSEVVYFGRNVYDYVLQVRTEEVVRTCCPDFPVLGAVDTRAVILTACGPAAHAATETTETETETVTDATSAGHDTITRVFLPRVGINEDNVCGSAHCGIARHYSDLLHKTELSCYEPSARPGSLHMTLGNKDGRLDLRAPCHITFGPAVMQLPPGLE
jgi:predicted PhzF superfamily epimerase YddE/YHI9